LSKLVDEIISVFPNYLTVKIEKEIDDFIIEGKILFSLGIIINEIMTNLMKYSCVDKDDCVIKISASLSENKVRLIIHDNGVEFPYKFDHQISEGFGLSIINMLVMQLNGNIQYIADNGTKRILEFYI
jgi:two-component sensor histidine kinase